MVVVVAVVIYLRGETVEDGEPEVNESEREVLVEEIVEEFAYSRVRPLAVNEEKPLQVPGDGVDDELVVNT